MKDADTIKVLCVDDNPDLAFLLERSVARQPDMQSVGRVLDVDQLLDAVRRHRPAVVVLDLRMPGKDTLDVMREMHAAFPETRTLIYSGLEQDEEVERARRAGAWGYIPKRDDLTVLLHAIRRVAAGERVFPAF